ncbi:MAG TPA: uroporphyrinogen-III C-methyltransferase [Vicinamibacterales bacterium]|nr:uroporphyrinogen-III C-methyltransferase [Vicinamibacterales bacterium]HOQ61554.1 uroporphyrinogen-III C-methyltransferase [Vicinamibacterales bacterium]HPK71298.1 uroporphyrinogen-III C-methyltransferase [Vicinamibacterales bacterium]
MPNRPRVCFIGAGPGDPGLLTLRGARCLGRADVVVYDSLVHAALLRHAPPGAERIDVGRAAPQGTDRDAIAYLLVEKVREGKHVARLKWGDPFIFDDGGEEALFLHEHGIPFEVVPGIPAAVGVPPYAGVAVTYRGGGDTLTLVRGFEDARGRLPRIDWASLARLDGTIVCYAGPAQAPAILAALAAHGRPADEPAALIYSGTLATQQTVAGTLSSLAGAPPPADSRPAIVVVGRVAALREHLRWFDVRPLFGRRIVVTRPREQARELVDLLEDQGAQVVLAPTVRLAPAGDGSELDEVCAGIGAFDWVVLPTLTGAEVFLRRLTTAPHDIRDLKGVGLCAIGQSSAERLAAFGLRADIAPPELRPDALVEALAARKGVRGRQVLLVQAEGARDLLAAELRKAGAEVREVGAYRIERVLPGDPGEPDLYKMLLEQQIDVVTFVSPSTVREFVDIHGADAVADVLRTTLVACVGPVTAQAAIAHGLMPAIVPEEFTMAAMVQAIVRYLRNPPDAASSPR